MERRKAQDGGGLLAGEHIRPGDVGAQLGRHVEPKRIALFGADEDRVVFVDAAEGLVVLLVAEPFEERLAIEVEAAIGVEDVALAHEFDGVDVGARAHGAAQSDLGVDAERLLDGAPSRNLGVVAGERGLGLRIGVRQIVVGAQLL